MSLKISTLFSNIYKKFIYFSVDRLASILFFLQTIFRAEESKYTIGTDTFWVRKNTSDIFVLQEVYEKKVYGEQPQGIVVDVGANIGAFSIYASNQANKVYSFEPESSNYEQLLKNIKLNNKEKVVIPHKMAVGRENKKINIYKGRFNKGVSSTLNKKSGEKETVKMRNLSDLMDELNIDKIDLLKIDIEGGEYDLLYGLPKKRFKVIDKIMLEYHYVAGESATDLENYLRSLGFKVSVHKELGMFIGTGNLEAVRI